jgi:hypothetical protein
VAWRHGASWGAVGVGAEGSLAGQELERWIHALHPSGIYLGNDELVEMQMLLKNFSCI